MGRRFLFSETDIFLDFVELFVRYFVSVNFAFLQNFFDLLVGDLRDALLEIGEEMLDAFGDFAFEVAVAGFASLVGNDVLEFAMGEE